MLFLRAQQTFSVSKGISSVGARMAFQHLNPAVSEIKSFIYLNVCNIAAFQQNPLC